MLFKDKIACTIVLVSTQLQDHSCVSLHYSIVCFMCRVKLLKTENGKMVKMKCMKTNTSHYSSYY